MTTENTGITIPAVQGGAVYGRYAAPMVQALPGGRIHSGVPTYLQGPEQAEEFGLALLAIAAHVRQETAQRQSAR